MCDRNSFIVYALHIKIIGFATLFIQENILNNGRHMKFFSCLVYFSHLNVLGHIMNLIISSLLFYEVKLILVTRAEKQRHYRKHFPHLTI